MSSPNPVLRILSWNLWHGLNPYQRLLMLPLENPLARRRRRLAQIRVISAWCRGADDVLCLQEVNPLRREIKRLQAALAMKGEGCVVNSGLKLGSVGLPPLLEEGLGIFWTEGIRKQEVREKSLSGRARELDGPLGAFVRLQFEEVRKALLLEAEWRGRKIAIVNLHLHNGTDSNPVDQRRKAMELASLKDFLQPRLGDWDFLAVCGDFNSDLHSPCLKALEEMGLRDAHELAGQKPEPTWDPGTNPLARLSPQLAKSEELRAWDGASHCFDRIFLRSKEPLQSVHVNLLREPGLSDHYGLAAEIVFQPAAKRSPESP